jgi:hypothetical protein
LSQGLETYVAELQALANQQEEQDLVEQEPEKKDQVGRAGPRPARLS